LGEFSEMLAWAASLALGYYRVYSTHHHIAELSNMVVSLHMNCCLGAARFLAAEHVCASFPKYTFDSPTRQDDITESAALHLLRYVKGMWRGPRSGEGDFSPASPHRTDNGPCTNLLRSLIVVIADRSVNAPSKERHRARVTACAN
jgi:hypothetical protein